MDLLGVCANAQYLVLQVVIYYHNYKPALGGRTNGSVHAEGWFLRMANGSIFEDTFLFSLTEEKLLITSMSLANGLRFPLVLQNH